MRLAVVFSGQGSQQLRHWQRLKQEAHGELADALLRALPCWPLDTPDDAQLALNRHAQPFIYGYQMLLWQQLSPILPKPVCVAGYSLGEVAASAAAGAIDWVAGVALSVQRAELMDAACPEPAGLLAVLGLDPATTAAICQQSGAALAIQNAPEHVVLGGTDSILTMVKQRAQQAGAVRVQRLAVTTPSHTPLLHAASEGFKQALAQWGSCERLAFPVLRGMDGRVCYSKAELLDALAAQISHSLYWDACLSSLVEMQPDRVLEIGPGNALCRMLNDIAPGLAARSVDEFKTLDGIRSWVFG